MEGKVVILTVFIIMNLFMSQIEVEANSSSNPGNCCPTWAHRVAYEVCRASQPPFPPFDRDTTTCDKISGCTCTILQGYDNDIHENTGGCCPSWVYRIAYEGCLATGGGVSYCEEINHCKCPQGYDNHILENSGDVNEYCKLGCASFMRNALSTLQNYDGASEIVNRAVKKCTKACSTFSTKSSKQALENVA